MWRWSFGAQENIQIIKYLQQTLIHVWIYIYCPDQEEESAIPACTSCCRITLHMELCLSHISALWDFFFFNKYSSLVEQGGWREILNISGDSFKVICLCSEHKDSRERDHLILGHPGRVTAASCCSQGSHSSGLLLCWLLGVFFFRLMLLSWDSSFYLFIFSFTICKSHKSKTKPSWSCLSAA